MYCETAAVFLRGCGSGVSVCVCLCVCVCVRVCNNTNFFRFAQYFFMSVNMQIYVLARHLQPFTFHTQIEAEEGRVGEHDEALFLSPPHRYHAKGNMIMGPFASTLIACTSPCSPGPSVAVSPNRSAKPSRFSFSSRASCRRRPFTVSFS